MQCPSCGKQNRPGARYCDNCATALSQSAQNPLQPLPPLQATPPAVGPGGQGYQSQTTTIQPPVPTLPPAPNQSTGAVTLPRTPAQRWLLSCLIGVIGGSGYVGVIALGLAIGSTFGAFLGYLSIPLLPVAAGWIAGKVIVQRSMGIVVVFFLLCTLFTWGRLLDVVSGSSIDAILLSFLVAFLPGAPLGLLGSWLATRKHPFYRKGQSATVGTTAQPGQQSSFVGEAHNIQSRSEQKSSMFLSQSGSIQIQILEFRLQYFDTAGNRVMNLPVELRGRSITGGLTDGDQVEVKGEVHNGLVQVSQINNLTTHALVRAEPVVNIFTTIRIIYFIIFIIIFIIVVIFIVSIIQTAPPHLPQ